ncbi:NACHT domain-containing protein [Microcoleus sp. B3-C5]|uniref:NACHT domain-containing protein n=1 Tax=Microcoleus sp. B3-C5 TaxID=2818654 RepID=UPI002FD15275
MRNISKTGLLIAATVPHNIRKCCISDEFASCGVEARSQTEFALSQGRGLILLDGLDEVPESDSDAVVRQIRQFVQKYYNNLFIITCRIAASKYRFHDEAFTCVEVADFNCEQIAAFAINWFVAFSHNLEAGKALASQFVEKLKLQKNQQIRELAVTPILQYGLLKAWEALRF